MIVAPFVVVVVFKSGQVMTFQERQRSRAENIAAEYRKYSTVKSATLYVQVDEG